MSRSTTAREALIAELIGDIGDLLERVGSLTTRVESLTAEVQSLPKMLDEARKEMRDATSMLDSRLEPFRHHLAAEMEKAKHVAIRAFIAQTNHVAAQEQVKQSNAMTAAARTILDKELEPPVRQFSQTLQRLVDKADRPCFTPPPSRVRRSARAGLPSIFSAGDPWRQRTASQRLKTSVVADPMTAVDPRSRLWSPLVWMPEGRRSPKRQAPNGWIRTLCGLHGRKADDRDRPRFVVSGTCLRQAAIQSYLEQSTSFMGSSVRFMPLRGTSPSVSQLRSSSL